MLNSEQILTEISELFSRYRNEHGELEFFQNKLRGSTTTKNGSNLVQDYDAWLKRCGGQRQEPEKENPFLSSILQINFDGTPGRQFYGWQVKVLERLQNKNNDVYVVAPPGGGKTTPLMAHYMVDIFMGGENGSMKTLHADSILEDTPHSGLVEKWTNIFHSLLSGKQFNSSRSVPRCLFITPIRVLSFEQAEGFQDYFLDLLLFLRSIIEKAQKQNNGENFQAYMNRLKQGPKDIDKIIGNVFGSLGEQSFNRVKQDAKQFGSWAKQFTERIICVKTGGGSGNFNSNPKDAIVTISTYGSAKNFISSISNQVKFIVFDEAHLYMPSEYGGDRSQENEVNAASDAYTIIDGMSKQKDAQIAFLSGTIHPVSAENFCNFLNRRYGRNLAVVSTEKGDTEAGNKTELHVIPDDALRSEKEQINRIVQWVQRGEKGNAIILFSKRKINNLVQKAIERLSQKDIRYDFNTPTNDRAKREKIDRYRRALAYSNPNASPEEIKKMVDEFTKREFPSTQQTEIEKIKKKPGAMMIENKNLRTAVGYGIGYIYRKDDIEPTDHNADYYADPDPISENDKLIVAKLFSEGKINVLIATDSIGIGVNVNIKNMYLPSCMKFEKNKNNEGKMELNNKRNLSQLINRTGRGKTPISGIYTPNEFVPYLQSIVTAGAENFNVVPAITIRPTDNLKEVLMNLSSAVTNSAAEKISKVERIHYKISEKLNNFGNKLGEVLNLTHRRQETEAKNNEYLRQQVKIESRQLQANLDSIVKYQNAQSKIEELRRKIERYEEQSRRIQDKIRETETRLNQPNIPNKSLLEKHQLTRKTWLMRIQTEQLLCAIEEYNEIQRELDEILSHRNEMKYSDQGVSSNRHKELTGLLSEIGRRYSPEFLQNRNTAINALNNEVRQRQKELEEMRKTEDTISANLNTPPEIRNSVQHDIRVQQQTIQRLIDSMRRIQFYR